MVMNKKVLTIAMTFLISAGSFTPTFAAENNDVPVTTAPPAVERIQRTVQRGRHHTG